jgi:lipopolysaccharide transport system permease protein
MDEEKQRLPVKIVKPGSSSLMEYIMEVWCFRRYIFVFAKQEFDVQYVQTKLSVLWVLLKPLMVLAIFTFIFDRLMHIPGQQHPYPLFALIGLLVWNNFSFLVNNGGNIIISNQDLIKKVYFPRVVLLLSKFLISLIELGVSLLLILILMIILHVPFDWKIVFVPAFLTISIMCGLTIALWLNAFSIKYRDLQQFVPTLIGFLIWLTPVFYPVTLVPNEYSFILYLNPIAATIQGCRWAILNDAPPSLCYLPMIIFNLFVFCVGLIVFIRSEVDVVDYV